ncbi:hypothetical protein F5883DRAFT_163981 [Diaporthe sp. PMI_573]|nr:hypothetical protein F5883DRAFT_163981 [Diaporthaceae sp. PMI_573]
MPAAQEGESSAPQSFVSAVKRAGGRPPCVLHALYLPHHLTQGDGAPRGLRGRAGGEGPDAAKADGHERGGGGWALRPSSSSYLGRRGPPTPARVSEGPPHPRPGPRETGQEAREHIGLSSLRTPLSGGRDGTRGCVWAGGVGYSFLDFFFLLLLLLLLVAVVGLARESGCVVWVFLALHACWSGHRGRGPVSGGYRPILNQVNFPGSTQPARPARFQPSPAPNLRHRGRNRDVEVTNYGVWCVYVGLWCVYVM